MIQNKNKLREVGLEPDKPTGYVRGIWALTLILAFALVVGSGIFYILWSSPWGESSYWYRNSVNDETNDWQNYTNSAYDLSIKYPKDWGSREFSKDTGNEKDWRLAVSFYNPELKSAVEGLQDTSLIFDAALYVYNTDQRAQFSAGGCTKERDLTVAQKNGELDKCFNEMAAKYYYNYIVVNNDKTFVLESLEEKKDTLDKMVGTLTFGGATTSPTTTQSNVKYKTFSDKIHVDFSFEYPENLFAFGNISGEGYQGTVYVLKQSADKNEMERTNIQVYLKMIQPQTTDIRTAYKNVHGGDLSSDQSKFQNKTVAGVPALKYEETTITSYLFIKDNFLFEIAAVDEFALGSDSNPFSDPTTKAAFDHIVSSFKFL